MVSIAEVAAAAGVSPTTVSHVISGKRRVSRELIERVRTVMAELDYQPSQAARSLASGRTRILGLLVPDLARPFFAELATAVESVTSAAGYNLIIGNTGRDRERALAHIRMIKSRAVDGVIYAVGSAIDADIRQAVEGMPLVVVDDDEGPLAIPTLVSANQVGGEMAASHLSALGHSRAIVLTGADDVPAMRHRVAGFSTRWLEEYGGHLETAVTGVSESQMASIRQGAITCVFAVNDLMALDVLASLRRYGIKVPTQVSVVGFDDIPAAKHSWPPLTTVAQYPSELGEQAARKLLAILAGEPVEPTRDVLPVKLVVRESSAPLGHP